MRLDDLLPIESGPPIWEQYEVYRLIKRERGASLAHRIWNKYHTDTERARIWFNLHEAVLQNIYEQMLTNTVARGKQGKDFMAVLVYNVQAHYSKIDKGVETIWTRDRMTDKTAK